MCSDLCNIDWVWENNWWCQSDDPINHTDFTKLQKKSASLLTSIQEKTSALPDLGAKGPAKGYRKAKETISATHLRLFGLTFLKCWCFHVNGWIWDFLAESSEIQC